MTDPEAAHRFADQLHRDAARLWYEEAAGRGNIRAMHNLAVLHADPNSDLANIELAADWFRKAAEQNDALGQNNLGLMYQEGRGVRQGDVEAAKWFRKSAEQNHPMGQNSLGVMYAKGRGVPQSDAEAVRWYRKAAEQNDARGQNNLGWMYREGRGVPQDDVEAVNRVLRDAGHAVRCRWVGQIDQLAEVCDAGTNVLVMGTGNSGHDVAQDLHAAGANVTMMASALLKRVLERVRTLRIRLEAPLVVALTALHCSDGPRTSRRTCPRPWRATTS